MKKALFRSLPFVLMLCYTLFLSLPLVTHGQFSPSGFPNSTGNPPNSAGQAATSTPPGTTQIGFHIINPLGAETDTIPKAIKKIMDAVLTFVFPFIVLFFIYAGFKFVMARGNATKLKDARNMFLFTLLGTLLILGAWTIATAVVNTVNEITS